MEVKLFWVRAPDGPQSFKGESTGKHAHAFESQINAWLAENPGIEVMHIKQSASGGSWGPSLWLLSVWFTRN